MTDTPSYREIGVSRDGQVATVEMRRPPHNFFDSALVAEIGEAGVIVVFPEPVHLVLRYAKLEIFG